jgi:hypothetical protein
MVHPSRSSATETIVEDEKTREGHVPYGEVTMSRR